MLFLQGRSRVLIDSHNHVGYILKSPDAVVREMDALGIDVAWIMTWHMPRAEHADSYGASSDPRWVREDGTHPSMPLGGVIEACRRYPGRMIPGFCPDPRLPSAPDLFESAVRMFGVRVCGEFSYRMPMDAPCALELFDRAGRLGCPVVLHMDTPWLHDGVAGVRYVPDFVAGTVDHLERALHACPGTVFVGHAPAFWRAIGPDADVSTEVRPTGPVEPGGRVYQLLDTYPNLWADLSAGSGLNMLTRDPEHARRFILRYQDRLLYGRDQHGDALRDFLGTLDLPGSVTDKLYFQNALRLVPLG